MYIIAKKNREEKTFVNYSAVVDDKSLNSTLFYALRYLNQGFSIIPVKGSHYSKGVDIDERLKDTKAPLVKWSEYQQRLPTEKEIREWIDKWPMANIAIVTGKISHLVVVDFDSAEAVRWAKNKGYLNTAIVRTARGVHAYYSYPMEGYVKNSVDGDKKIDIRADGGYVIAPPSEHLTGMQYTWETVDVPITPLPEIFVSQARNKKVIDLKPLYKGVGKGSRNDTLARLCGSWVNDGLDYEDCMEMAEVWNQKNDPPLPAKEVERTVKSILYRHSLNDVTVQRMYHEKNLLRFPVFTHSRTRIHKVEEISVVQEYGKESRKWVVIPSKMGLPGPFDEAVFMAINMVLSEMPKPISNPVEVGGLRDIARMINLNHSSGKVSKMIKESMLRIKSLTIITEKTFYDAEKRKFITDSFGIFDRIIFSGQKADDEERIYTTKIWLNLVFLKNINAGFASSLSYSTYISLNNGLARGIYRCLSPVLALSDNLPVNISYKKLAQRLQVKEEYSPSRIRTQLSEAHKELQKKVFSKVIITQTSSGKVIVTYFR